MKVDRISYQRVYPIGLYVNERIGVEIQVDEGEDSTEVFNHAKKMVDGWHESGKALLPTDVPLAENNYIDEGINGAPQSDSFPEVGMQAAIKTCSSVPVLKTFRKLIYDIQKDPVLMEMYENKLRELSTNK
jgi:hypothetical protein